MTFALILLALIVLLVIGVFRERQVRAAMTQEERDDEDREMRTW